MSTTQETVNPPSDANARQGRKPWLMISAGAALLVVGAVTAGYFFMHSSSATAHAGEDARLAKASGQQNVKADAKPIYYALDPAFVVNFKDKDAVRFLQVAVEVAARTQSAIEAMKTFQPVIRNNLVMLFSSQSYATLSTRRGKEKLRDKALAEIQKVLKINHDRANVEAVYFTRFVMQ